MMFIILLSVSIVTASNTVYTLYSNESSILKSIPKPKTDEDEIHFLFYTRNNSERFHQLRINDNETLKNSDFNFNVSLKVIIHGWISNNETMNAIETLKDALLNKTEDNIIVVDWSKLASVQYKTAYKFSSTVTTILIEFITFLIANGVSPEKLHFIGHSIGAHIAGNAGHYFRNQNKTVDAIIGLDPSYPHYKFCSDDERLDKEDARHVEVIHSNGGVWGYRSEMGHVDFFPNGGRYQPGCRQDKRETCAHDRAILYYAYSIIGTKFVGIAVIFDVPKIKYFTKKKLVMGGVKLNHGKKGSYWLRTGHSPPFEFNPDDDDK